MSQETTKIKAILELPVDDGVTFDNKVIIDECSKLLVRRKNENVEVVQKALLLRGRAFARAKQYSDALKDASDLLDIDSKNEGAGLLRIAMLCKLDRGRDAEAEIKDALKQYPHSPRVHLLYGVMILTITNDGELAIKAFDKAISSDSKYGPAYYYRGIVHSRLDPEKCLADLNKFIELSPSDNTYDYSLVYARRGGALFALNRTNESMASLLMARKLNPSSGRIALDLAITYFEMNKINLAVHCAEEGIRLAPKTPEGFGQLAIYYAKLNRKKDAIEAADKFIRSEPENSDLFGAIADVEAAVGRFDSALKYYAKALDFEPKDESTRVYKASFLATCPDAKYRDGKAAVALAESAHQNKDRPTYARWQSAIALAEAHAELGNFQEAVSYAREAIELAGENNGKREDLMAKLALFEKKTPFRFATPK